MGDLSEHFSRSEFACKDGCGKDTVDAELLSVLEDVRNHFGRAVYINSGNRCEEHNRAVGGVPDSQHTKSRAADIRVAGTMPDDVALYLLKKYENEYGIGMYDTFVHIDTRTGSKSRWDFRSH